MRVDFPGLGEARAGVLSRWKTLLLSRCGAASWCGEALSRGLPHGKVEME